MVEHQHHFITRNGGKEGREKKVPLVRGSYLGEFVFHVAECFNNKTLHFGRTTLWELSGSSKPPIITLVKNSANAFKCFSTEVLPKLLVVFVIL